MAIYVDISAAVHRRAGLGRYAGSLARALLEADASRYALFHNLERGYRPLEGLGRAPVRCIRLGYKPWRMAVWLGQLGHLAFDRLLPGADVYHATEHLLMPLRQVPTILTVHDLIFRLFPEHHKRLNYWYLNLTMPLYCRRASAIICVSQSTKQDLVKCYDVPGDKITVVHEAAADHFRPVSSEAIRQVCAKHHLRQPYTLCVGTIEPRKNLMRLLDAMEILRRRGAGFQLALVGGKGWLYQDLMQRLETIPSNECRLLGYVPEDDMPALYSGAVLTVLPSLYEGFGLPVLEAMACGTPVVCSSRASLPEIGGDAARYFDPYQVQDMADAIHQVLTEADLRDAMRVRGLERAAGFSWSLAARDTAAVYQKVTTSCQ